jgi:hypothetical protein
MPHIVIEEIWSTSSTADERRLLRASAAPLFAGLRQAAYEYAKRRASEYDTHRFNEDAKRSYWWGRNAGDRATHRFVIRPALAVYQLRT